MHTISLLKSWFDRNAVVGHKARTAALLRVVDALLHGGKLALTHLGRHRRGDAFVKHHIKAVDRLLGNRHLHAERAGIYAALAKTLLRGSKRPIIIIDWTDCELERKLLILRAALPVGGRAISLYEEAHPMRWYNSPKTHRRFLRRLHDILPPGCCPIIVTDAGFKGPWFREVESYGWDWIGRLRGNVKYLRPEDEKWLPTTSLHRQATEHMRHVGWRYLSPRHRYWCGLYLMRAYHRGPGRPRKRTGYINNGMYRRRHHGVWLLATSLPHSRQACSFIKRTYAKRMSIEESIRDLKSHRWGFALRYARTMHTARLEILLLVGAIATFVLWLVGLAAKRRNWVRHFQANTETNRRVLSIVFLGKEVLRSTRLRLSRRELSAAFNRLRYLVVTEGCTA